MTGHGGAFRTPPPGQEAAKKRWADISSDEEVEIKYRAAKGYCHVSMVRSFAAFSATVSLRVASQVEELQWSEVGGGDWVGFPNSKGFAIRGVTVADWVCFRFQVWG